MKKEIEKIMRDDPFLNMQETVYKYLYESIITLKLAPGSSVSEVAIARELDSSRTPIRNAIMQLQDEGLVVRDKGRSLIVARLGKDECRNLMEGRIAIEGRAAYLAAERISSREMKELEESHKEFVAARRKWDVVRMVEYDHEFHQRIVDAAGNDFIKNMYEAIRPKNLHYRNYLYRMAGDEDLKPIMTGSSRHHKGIISAIKLGLAEEAQSRMIRDISGMENIIGVWE